MPDITIIEPDTMRRTFAGLRDALFDELDAIRSGNGDFARVRAVSQIAGRVHDNIHAEAKARRMLGTNAGVGTADIEGMLR